MASPGGRGSLDLLSADVSEPRYQIWCEEVLTGKGVNHHRGLPTVKPCLRWTYKFLSRTPARTLGWPLPCSVSNQQAGSAWHPGQMSSKLSKVQAQQTAGAGDLGKCKHHHVLGSPMQCLATCSAPGWVSAGLDTQVNWAEPARRLMSYDLRHSTLETEVELYLAFP